MTSPQKLLREREIRPRKTLGQNFLVHAESAEKILRWADLKQPSPILEIGAGLGALTRALRKARHRVWALEKDQKLVSYLKEEWSWDPQLTLLGQDALDTDYEKLSQEAGAPLAVVANLPYSVSTPLLERMLNHLSIFSQMVLLLQEEVANRICAAPGSKNYGRLSIWSQTLCTTERGPRIPRGSFFPVPEVESRLIRLTPRSETFVRPDQLPSFLKTTAQIFRYRRKSLRNALLEGGFLLEAVVQAQDKTKLDLSRRPQTLSPEDLFALHQALRSSSG